MAYQELIKNFERTRSYLRDFYVYGFRSRNEYDSKSARSYDNERRRIESWLGDCMRFRFGDNGKSVFISVDSRDIPSNPMFRAFRAKSFTDMDICLHFLIMDLFADGGEYSVPVAISRLCERFPELSDKRFLAESANIRNKIREYESLGILTSRKSGRALLYRLADSPLNIPQWHDALCFFSEVFPLGVIGSYALDGNVSDSPFRFKHAMLFPATDSIVLEDLLQCIESGSQAVLTTFSRKKGRVQRHTVLPVRFFISTLYGRQYLLAREESAQRFIFFRLDDIRKVQKGAPCPDAQSIEEQYNDFSRFLWGVSNRVAGQPDHIEMDIFACDDEPYIPQRLMRERRCGTVTQTEKNVWRYSADVYDAKEMLPWIRTFIGRIVRLTCSRPEILKAFREDLGATAALYGEGADNAVQ